MTKEKLKDIIELENKIKFLQDELDTYKKNLNKDRLYINFGWEYNVLINKEHELYLMQLAIFNRYLEIKEKELKKLKEKFKQM